MGFCVRNSGNVVDGESERRRLTIDLFRRAMSRGSPVDFLALRVGVKGLSRGTKTHLRYQLLDHYNRRSGVSAMARTTAYPCTSVALLMGRREIKETGIVTPERIAQNDRLFHFVLDRLAERGVRMKMTTLS